MQSAAVTLFGLLSVSAAQYLGHAGHAYAGHAIAPVAHAAYAPYYAPGSQFHAQDEFGNLNYGYANINSHKQEVGNTYGGVTGGYSYVDANGVLQTVRYIADGLGFRVEDSRLPVNNDALPVAPVYTGVAPTFNPEPLVAPTFNPEPLVAPVYTGVAPTAPEVTPEVAAATAEHLAAHAAAKSVEKREAAVIDGHTTVSQPLSAPHLIHNAPTPKIIAAPAHIGYAGLGHAGLGYAGLGHAGLGYAGLGYHGLGYAGLGHAGLGYAGLGYHGIGYGLHH